MLGVTPPPPNQDALRDHSVSESIRSGHREHTCLPTDSKRENIWTWASSRIEGQHTHFT